jgi:NADP+-dependent farnesol dehydrogenase
MEKWVNKTAVITGASSGIGKAILESFVKAGINVVGLARRAEKIEALGVELSKYPGKVYAYRCDITDLQSIKSAFKWIEEFVGDIHILVNNAGILRNVKILDTSTEGVTEKLNEVINTNFIGLVHCTREAFRLIQKSNDYGYIININSVSGYHVPFIGRKDHSHNVYNPSKFAVTATTEVIRQELIYMENDKIRVGSINPGVVETEIFEQGSFSTGKGGVYENRPQMRSEDIADAALYMLSTPYGVNVTELTLKPVGERFQ